MQIFIAITGVVGLVLLIFGWWGQHTESGQKKFDEMAGMIPFFAFYLGIILALISVSTLVYKVVQN